MKIISKKKVDKKIVQINIGLPIEIAQSLMLSGSKIEKLNNDGKNITIQFVMKRAINEYLQRADGK